MVEKIIKELEDKLTQVMSDLREELKKIRTGRAQSSMVEGVKVSYYGSQLSLVELATVTAPEPNLILIKPFDKNSIGDIETAIKNSDLGLSSANDGIFIRIVIPPLNEERRGEIAKRVKKIGEETKITIRNIRGESWSKVRDLKRENQITEDDYYRVEEKLNDTVSNFNGKIDNLVSEKEQEIMKI